MLEHDEQSPRRAGHRIPLGRRDLLILGLILAVAASLSARLIHGHAPVKAPGGATAVQSSRYDGLAVSDPKQAPPLALKSYLGAPVNIASFRGKAVLVTFLYTHCPLACPLITSKLHTALSEMSAAERRRVEVIAVSVDPRGDTPATVAQFLADHGMTGRMQYLIGSADALGAVWQRWGIGSRRDAGDPALVAHTALVYGITATGKIVTIYPSTFNPRSIVNDVPVLASA
jgi:protein SCO1